MEATGDLDLDRLIAAFAGSVWRDALPEADWPEPLYVSRFCERANASGMCRALANRFSQFLLAYGLDAEPRRFRPEQELGYPFSSVYCDHWTTVVYRPGGSFFSVDWTANQFRFASAQPFPLILKADSDDSFAHSRASSGDHDSFMRLSAVA